MSSENSKVAFAARVDANDYRLEDATKQTILSPGPVVFLELLEHNLNEMLRVAGHADRLRPHCKTHKMPAIVGMKRSLGITKFKCATIAEAEMLADAGVEDVLIAYQLVGPNVKRFVHLLDKFPATRFATIVDDLTALDQLSQALTDHAARHADVMIDLDTGMGRTGIAPDENAVQLYEAIGSTPQIRAAGLHWYDGHVRHQDLRERRIVVDHEYQELTRFRDRLLLAGFEIPEVVVSGTGAFPIWAEYDEPQMTLSPGTVTLYDAGYLEIFDDLAFKPALGVLTRVVSTRRAGHLTVDLGHKSIAADQPAGKRALFPELPDAEEVAHTEEHLVLKTERWSEFSVGDSFVALPRHVCPTSALHDSVSAVREGRLVEHWEVTGRSRRLTV